MPDIPLPLLAGFVPWEDQDQGGLCPSGPCVSGMCYYWGEVANSGPKLEGISYRVIPANGHFSGLTPYFSRGGAEFIRN